MRVLILLLAVLLPLSSSADSALPFMKDLAGDTGLETGPLDHAAPF